MIYINSATTTNIGPVYGIRIEINAALVGTVTITDDNVTKAVIAIGMTTSKVYYGFTGAVRIVTAGAENITVSILNTQG